MSDSKVDPAGRGWSSEDRRVIGWLGALPAVGAAIFTLAFFIAEPRLWPIAFLVAAVGAYATAFVGVVPVLLVFRRLRWTRPIHFAAGGSVGVLLPWFVVGVFKEYLSTGVVQFRFALPLLVAAGIGAGLSAIFAWRLRIVP